MARNLREGSKVSFKLGNRKKRVHGVVIKKFTARKGSLNVPLNKRTVVEVKAVGSIFVKIPSELKRRTRK